MAVSLDEIDVRLLGELQRDADRPNVELARIVGLSPAATLNRVKRLKGSGIITSITARLDPAAAGFPLQVYLSVTLGQHDEAKQRRFEKTVHDLPEIVCAEWVAGETDAWLTVVPRDVEDLQQVIAVLATRGGAERIVTILRLRVLKPQSPLPL